MDDWIINKQDIYNTINSLCKSHLKEIVKKISIWILILNWKKITKVSDFKNIYHDLTENEQKILANWIKHNQLGIRWIKTIENSLNEHLNTWFDYFVDKFYDDSLVDTISQELLSEINLNIN